MPLQRPNIERLPNNPILTADDWPYPINSVFNPGAIRLDDGRVLLLCRCEDFRGISHMTVATSENGIDNWKISSKPALKPKENTKLEEWGIEDPRIVKVEGEEGYYVTYTSFGRAGPGVSLAHTHDFKKWKRLGMILQPNDKDAALFSEKIDGHYVLIHRPLIHEYSLGDFADMWTSCSDDMKGWYRPEVFLTARQGAWWDARKIGLDCPPIKTKEGWLILYHGVRSHASGSLYRHGMALYDAENLNCTLRSSDHFMAPTEPYERVGDVPNVIFITGYVYEDEDTLLLYYGAADTSICVARASISDLLQYLKETGSRECHDERYAAIPKTLKK